MKTRLFYIRDSERNPVGCLAYQFDGKNIKYNFSCCNLSMKDRFAKKFGRELAIERLKNQPFVADSYLSSNELKFYELLEEVENNDFIPNRLRKLVRNYIIDNYDLHEHANPTTSSSAGYKSPAEKLSWYKRFNKYGIIFYVASTLSLIMAENWVWPALTILLFMCIIGATFPSILLKKYIK